MTHHLRLVAVLAVAIVAYAVLIQAFHLMSQPSDRSLYLGIGIILLLLVCVPAIVHAIWRKL